MPAQLEILFKTLPRRPWYRPKKEFVEGDVFPRKVVMMNDITSPFLPSDMLVTVKRVLPTGSLMAASGAVLLEILIEVARISEVSIPEGSHDNGDA